MRELELFVEYFKGHTSPLFSSLRLLPIVTSLGCVVGALLFRLVHSQPPLQSKDDTNL